MISRLKISMCRSKDCKAHFKYNLNSVIRKKLLKPFLFVIALTKFVETIDSIVISYNDRGDIRIFRLAYSHFDRLSQHDVSRIGKLPLTRSYYFVG